MPELRPAARILEIGPGEGWFRKAVEALKPVDYLTIDVDAPADIRGDIRDWRQHGLEPASFDVIIAFEVVEHAPCFQECYELLKPAGLLLLTTPVPEFDWVLKLLEALRLAQRRTSEHSHLVHVRDIPGFTIERARYPFGLGQWVILRKVEATS